MSSEPTGDGVSLFSKTGRSVLRVIDPNDYGHLYHAELSSGMLHRWRFGGATPSPEQYPALLWNGVLSQYLVLQPKSNAIVGLVAAYDYNANDGVGYLLGARFAEGVPATLAFVDGFGLFVDNLFELFPLRKLYLEVPEFNASHFQSALGSVFVEEGRLERHKFFSGSYWDQITFACWRQEWHAWRAGTLDPSSR